MSTQYNKVQKPYDELRKTTIAIIERVNVRELIFPFVRGAKVLDLACGTGHLSRYFLKWGASSVVGADISSAMLDEARALSKQDGLGNDQIRFLEADCSTPVAYEGGPFDIVSAAWLLNYAASGKDMVEMYRNIALNLKDGGHFVAVTPPPTSDPAGFIENERRLRPLPTASGGLFSTVTGTVDDGVEFHLHSDTPAGDLDFDCYHLRNEFYESAAREGGLKGELVWGVTKVPNGFMDHPEKFGEQSNGGAGAEELATYSKLPHYGLLLITK